MALGLGGNRMVHDRDTTLDSVRWQIESLRATTFHAPGGNVTDSTEAWNLVTGEQPDQVIARPREKVVQQTGTFEGKQLALIARQDRTDWIFQGVIGSPGEPMQGPPTLGLLSDSLKSLKKVAEEWLGNCPTVSRLAFGATLFIVVEDLPTAYSEMSRFLPNISLGGADSQDFLYQINRPRTSNSQNGMMINRLAKWSVIRGETISFGIRPGGGAILASASPDLACRLELDINTASESTTSVTQAQAKLLFCEMVELGIEIANRGDI